MSAKILIIDTDRSFVKSLERTLDMCGFEVLDAPDGMIGVQMALRHRPNLIIQELQFPSGGALFVLQNLRRSLITRDIPVLIVTGSMDSAAKQRLIAAGVKTYVEKPCEKEDLLARVYELLGAESPKRPLSYPKPIVSSGDFTLAPPPEAIQEDQKTKKA